MSELSKTELAEQFLALRPKLLQLLHFRIHPLLRQRFDPEDVLQEAYLAAEKRIEHFKTPKSSTFKEALVVWLRMIVMIVMPQPSMIWIVMGC